MDLCIRSSATAVLTLGANSHFTPVNFWRDYRFEGTRLTISSNADTTLMFYTQRRRSPSLETEFAVIERTDDLLGNADLVLVNKNVLSLKAFETKTVDLPHMIDIVFVSSTEAATITVSLSILSDQGGGAFIREDNVDLNNLAAYHPVASLTFNYATGAQMIVDPGFWVDNVVTPTYFRTNETSQGAIVKTTGFTRVSVCFGRHLYESAAYTLSVISIRKARTEAELWASEDNWIHGVQATTDGPTLLFANLEPGPWFIQWRLAHQPILTGCTIACDSHEQPTDPNFTEGFIGHDFVGYETQGPGTFETITWTMPTRNFVVLSDSNAASSVYGDPDDATPGGDNVLSYEPRNGVLPELVADAVGTRYWNEGGALVQWEYLVIHRWGREHGYIPRIINNSFGGRWQSAMGAARRAVLSAGAFPWPGVYVDLYDGVTNNFTYRTNHSNTSFVAGGDWTGGITAHGVLLGSFYNDYFQAQIGSDTNFVGATFKNNLAKAAGPSLIKAIFTQWPNAALFVYGPEIADNTFPATTITDLRAAMATDVVYYNFTTAGGVKYDANKGRFITLSDFSATTGISPVFAHVHMKKSEHAAIAAAVYNKFDELNFIT